jgi:hypothetical protein
LVNCLLHFRAAHISTTLQIALVNRRMSKMELGLTKEQIAALDWWLRVHPRDTEKGDGTDKYFQWPQFKLTRQGYRAIGDRF